jgi:enoyl-CoA hydratase
MPYVAAMTRVHSETNDNVMTITMDDGRANALAPEMQRELNDALDAAEAAGAGVVLAGRAGRFSGGFDLGVLTAGGPDALGMLRGGFELSERLLSFPTPIVIACTGHAVAMGSFLLLSGDYRVGAAGAFTIRANEVAIGMTMPHAALALIRGRLTPAHADRAAILSEAYTPEGAVEAGFLDRIVALDEVVATAQSVAASFMTLDAAAHARTKVRARAETLQHIRDGIDAEFSPRT